MSTYKQASQDANQSTISVESAYTLALDHLKAGRYQDVDKLCTAILQVVPDHIDAINLLGIVAQAINRHDLAAQQFQAAINIDASRALLHYNLGVSLYKSGYKVRAIQVLKTAIEIEPGNRQIINYLNELQNSVVDAAYKVLQQGQELQGQGHLKDAESCYEKAILLKADFAQAYNCLGSLLSDQGRLVDAVINYQKAIAFEEDYAEAYNNLGNALKDQGRLDEAVANYQKAIALHAGFAECYINLGLTLIEQGKHDSAVSSIQKAITIDPENSRYWSMFAQSIQRFRFTTYEDSSYRYLLQMLEQSTIRPQDVSAVVVAALCQHPCIIDALKISSSGTVVKHRDSLADSLGEIPLLIRIMELSLIADLSVEKLFTEMRESLLTDVLSGVGRFKGQGFYQALAVHCFINEYVYFESAKEREQVVELQDKAMAAYEKGQSIPLLWIVSLATYRPLHSFIWSDKLSGQGYAEIKR
ncbi:MAG: tetratricopeptide repeat protein, partial [Magnetococcales bacterium]|nr:tetratricopeptide repeat protein [Magnetococcales bacterium]